MITVESLIYEIDTKLNKLTTLENQEIPIENKIFAINKAQIKLVKKKMNPNNILQLGFDGNKKRHEDLQVLVEPAHKHPLTPRMKDVKLNKWSVEIDELKDYMFYIEAYLIAEKDSCKDRVIYVNNDLTKHGDVVTLLNNSNYKPSFEYQETFSTLSGNEVELYTDGTFDLTKAFISYLRYPQEVDFPGYEKLDGKESKRVDCELPKFLEDELINLAIQELAMATENIPAVQMTDKRIQTEE